MSAEAFLVRQARIAGEAAVRTLHPPEPFAAGDSHGVGAELYRQAIHWGLAARVAVTSNSQSASESNPVVSEPTLPSLEKLLTSTPRLTLREWARDEAHLERCVHHLRLAPYTLHTEANEAEQRQACDDLASFYRSLMRPLVPVQRAAERAALKRNLVLMAIGLSIAAVGAGMWQGVRWYKVSRDLALDAKWTTSSVLNAALECRSPNQECKEGQGFFFHTLQENNPWLILDLKKDRSFSSVEVLNRQDCCGERANPITISVSKDKKNWQVVAERKSEFRVFNATFPEVTARYVKVEIPKPASMLHLKRVRVLP